VVLRTHRVTKTKTHRETLSVLELLHRVQTEEAAYKSVFLQKDLVPSERELPLPYTVAGVTVLWLFAQTFSKPSFPELRNSRRHFSADSFETTKLKIDAVQQCIWVEACCYVTEKLRNLFTSNRPDDS
jgi:hypothetical protein